MADTQATASLLLVHDVFLTKEEYRQHRYIGWADLVGTPVIVAWYIALSTVTAQEVALTPEPLSAAAFAAHVALACIGFLGFFYHTQIWPVKADEETYHATKYVGKWLFLTRHCLALQAVHLILSLLGTALGNAHLMRLTYGSSFWIGALGFFVTIQFFTLVHNNAEYIVYCKGMADVRGFCGMLDYRGYMTWLHLPALPLAIADVLLVKRHVTLAVSCSLVASGCMMLFYCVFYVGLVVCNFLATGYFPYAVLRELKSVCSWACFIVLQASLLMVFALSLYGLSLLPQPWL